MNELGSPRIFFLGLDAADKDLIENWASQGHLPTFKSLLETSLYGDIDTPRGLEAGSVWPTFYCGLKPGNQQQYDGARVFDSKIYDHISFQPDKDTKKAFWTTLSDAGKRCIVVDAPYNYPVDTVNGIKVVDRAGHVPAGGGNFLHLRTNPPELASEITTMFGEDPAKGLSSDYFAMETAEDVNEFVRIYRERIESKADMILHLWGKERWDLCLSIFSEAHCAGHRCWHLHDPTHSLHNAQLVKLVGNPLLEIYKALDAAIGKMKSAVENNASFVVYLSHGMGPRHSGTRLLDRILARYDNQKVATRSGVVMNIARQVWRVMPENMRKPFLKIRNNVTNDGFQPNRETRRFFEVYANDRTAGVRINLIGREAQGVVSEEEYDNVCKLLIEELLELKNPESGGKAVREVIKTRDLYSGAFLNQLPDLLVTWNRSHPINSLESTKLGKVDCEGIDMTTRTGDHRIKGRFFALGRDMQASKLSVNVKTEDFAVTIASMLSVNLDDTDGRVIKEMLLKSNSPAANTPQSKTTEIPGSL